MEEIIGFMFRLAALKRIVRTGWNMKFPEGSRFKMRSVPGSESVSDHMYGLAMLAFFVARKLGLDEHKLVRMALVHDFPELITLDIVTATIEDPEARARAEIEKRHREDEAMRRIFLSLDAWGRECYELWLEFEAQDSAEARVLKQLDKIEACVQAIFYREDGHEVDPFEFLDHSAPYMQHPELVLLFEELRRRAGIRT
jgi:putative hydrolase of HD superfamily